MGNGCFRTTGLSSLLLAWHGWKGISRLSSSVSSLNKSISYGEFVEISQTKTGPCDQGNGWIYRLTAGIIVVGIKLKSQEIDCILWARGEIVVTHTQAVQPLTYRSKFYSLEE